MSEKNYHPPMHTAEHILNQTMVRMFGCGRSFNAHIERKKSKCDYRLPHPLTDNHISEIERIVNQEISKNQPVTERFVSFDEAEKLVDMQKLPDNVGESIRIICVGEYDFCACIGPHVSNTSEIGTFSITTHSWEEGVLRLRFKVL
jgi:alanyl-tRNA synthetase